MAADRNQAGKISNVKQILPQLPSQPGPLDQLLLEELAPHQQDLRNPYKPSGLWYPFNFATQRKYRMLSFIFLLASNLSCVKKKKSNEHY